VVTIIMPIRNEAAFIHRSLGAVIAQDYPQQCLQILVVDGMSTDNTRAIVIDLAARHPNIRLLDNPRQTVPAALNRALQEAQGDIIIRVDGHCEIAPDYIRRCLEAFEQPGADCIGGPLVTVGNNTLARAIALAQSSPFGVGGVAFRTGSSNGRYVDTLAFGAYRREVFDRIGRFDEELIRNQDDEFNFRLIQAGGKI
jgi:cellulose synthase/poly-beta-1,6-N-acetylglucosamine synthase-like glycosyltransferase